RVVREDPDREGLLYAGTEMGMFISFDNGANWQEFRLNMPHVPINDIKIFRKDLIVATQGRAMWILDNVSALHQTTAQSKRTEFSVFTPRAGYRTRVGPSILGPTIDYRLPTAPSGAVEIEIRDVAGTLVNRYSSATPAATPGRGGRGGGGGGDPDDPESM